MLRKDMIHIQHITKRSHARKQDRSQRRFLLCCRAKDILYAQMQVGLDTCAEAKIHSRTKLRKNHYTSGSESDVVGGAGQPPHPGGILMEITCFD